MCQSLKSKTQKFLARACYNLEEKGLEWTIEELIEFENIINSTVETLQTKKQTLLDKLNLSKKESNDS